MRGLTMVVVVVMVMLSMTIMPSSAQDNPMGLPICWAKIDDCTAKAGIVDPEDPMVDFSICCPVIKPQVANTTCFCSIKDYLKNIPNEEPAVVASKVEALANKLLSDCKISSTFDQMCNGVSESENATSESTNEVGNKMPGLGKSGATKIKSIIGFVPAGALFVWTMILS